MTTYTKLQNGQWGLRSTERLVAGTRIIVTKRDGTTKTETVGYTTCEAGTTATIATPTFPPRMQRATTHTPRCGCPCHHTGGGCCQSCRFDGCPIAEAHGHHAD